MLPLLTALLLATLITASGCATKKIKATNNTKPISVHTEQFSAEIEPGSARKWFVLVEGDGAAWPTPNRPPIDPTPRDSVLLRLAEIVQHKTKANVLYVARPCQYPEQIDIHCEVRDWTTDRFAVRHVDALMDAVTNRIPTGSEVTVFGFSGGGVMALQLAGLLKRRFILKKIVLAGTPLDVNAWTNSHGYSQLTLENYRKGLQLLASEPVPVFALFGDLDTTVSDQHLGIANEIGLNVNVYLLPNTSHAGLPTADTTLEILTEP